MRSPSEEVACRELAEEVGGTAADFGYVGQFYTFNEISYVYLATELIEICLVPVDQGLRTARDKRRVASEGEISDGPSTQALLWCEALLNREGFYGDPARRGSRTHQPWLPSRADVHVSTGLFLSTTRYHPWGIDHSRTIPKDEKRLVPMICTYCKGTKLRLSIRSARFGSM
ncbi:MAG TPA: hypothetical protein VLY63_32980 [Anaerolineae bacterium]|nr:hypothetical protein [Anaerolineae bacterium]